MPLQHAFQTLPIRLSAACNAVPIALIKLINASHKHCQAFRPISVCVKKQVNATTIPAIAATSIPIGFILSTTLKAACTAVAIFVAVDQIVVAICAAFTVIVYPAQAAASVGKAGVKNFTTCKTPLSTSSTTFNATTSASGGIKESQPPAMLNTSLKISHND